MEDISDDKRVVLLQHLTEAGNDVLLPEPNLTSPVGYFYSAAQSVFQTPPGGELKHLEYLSEFGYLERQFFDKIHLCVCNRRQYALNFREVCPRCQSSNVNITDMIHHYSCGYTGAEPSFQDGMHYVCPKCDDELKHIGVDYEKVSTDYVCAACDRVFTEPEVVCQCLACPQQFDVERAVVKTLYTYRITAKGALVASRGSMEGELSNRRLVDPELSVYSFDYFEERLAQEFSGALRYKRPLCVIAAQIDALDDYELRFGRQAAARKLRDFAGIARESLRDSDAAAVYDQTVLVLILTDTPAKGAAVFANRLLQGVEIINSDRREENITASVGFAEMISDMSGPLALFEEAMDKLRDARTSGGACVRPLLNG